MYKRLAKLAALSFLIATHVVSADNNHSVPQNTSIEQQVVDVVQTKLADSKATFSPVFQNLPPLLSILSLENEGGGLACSSIGCVFPEQCCPTASGDECCTTGCGPVGCN